MVSWQVYWKKQVLIIEFPCLFPPRSIKSVTMSQNSLTIKKVIYLSIVIYCIWLWQASFLCVKNTGALWKLDFIAKRKQSAV